MQVVLFRSYFDTLDTMFVSFPIQQSTNYKFCLNEATQKENKEQNMHMTDTYQINTVQSKR